MIGVGNHISLFERQAPPHETEADEHLGARVTWARCTLRLKLENTRRVKSQRLVLFLTCRQLVFSGSAFGPRYVLQPIRLIDRHGLVDQAIAWFQISTQPKARQPGLLLR